MTTYVVDAVAIEMVTPVAEETAIVTTMVVYVAVIAEEKTMMMSVGDAIVETMTVKFDAIVVRMASMCGMTDTRTIAGV